MISIFFNVLHMMVKSPYDEYSCCASCGYVFCETLNECIRPWLTYCESLDNGH